MKEQRKGNHVAIAICFVAFLCYFAFKNGEYIGRFIYTLFH